MFIAIAFIAGAVLGLIIMKLIFQTKSSGTLLIEESEDKSNPYLFLELSEGINSLVYKKRITLKVDSQNYISHKKQSLL